MPLEKVQFFCQNWESKQELTGPRPISLSIDALFIHIFTCAWCAIGHKGNSSTPTRVGSKSLQNISVVVFRPVEIGLQLG